MVVPPSIKELELLKSFRERIKDVELSEKQRGDLYLLSWIRARDHDLTKAEQMFRASMEWRKANGIDNILNWKMPAFLEKEFPFQISGMDKNNCPVLIMPFGSWDVRKVVEMGERDNFVKYTDYMRCKVLDATDTADHFTQFTAVVDMKGYSFRQLTGHGCVDASLETVKRFEANFPERLKVGYIVNAPKVFSIIYALMKPLLSPVTLEKLRIYGSNASKWKAAVLNDIPADQLPVRYGGTSTTTFNLSDAPTDGTAATDTNELIEVTVGAGEKLEIQYEIKHPNTKLSWRYQTDDFDIGFSLYFQNGDEIVKYSRIEAHLTEQSGSILCERTGSYTLRFDNSYSVVRPKTLKYMVTIDAPEESDDEENTYM